MYVFKFKIIRKIEWDLNILWLNFYADQEGTESIFKTNIGVFWWLCWIIMNYSCCQRWIWEGGPKTILWWETSINHQFLFLFNLSISGMFLTFLVLHIYFEGQTIEQLTDRLKPQYSDREASKFMFDVVEGSFLSWRSWAYDRQQFIINEIPYKEHTWLKHISLCLKVIIFII